MNHDTAPVRPKEELNVNGLREYLSVHLPHATGATDIEIEQFPGGHSNLTYLIRVNGEEFVLRRPPLGPVAPKAHDMPREFRLLSTVHPHFACAPKPVLLCEDVSVIGAPFYLMERRQGLVIRNRIPPEIGGDLSVRRKVSEAVVDTLVALHKVDIYSSGIVQLGKPEGFVARQVAGWTSRWVRSKTSEVAEMDRVSEWLKDKLISEQDQHSTNHTLVHNDYKLDNVMLQLPDLSRVVAVLDWEMCSVGDPLIDLGLFLCYWTLKDDDETGQGSLSAVTNGPGWMTRDEILERYQSSTGRDVSRITFYETFALFKVAVILQQIFFRYARGQTNDQRFKDFDLRVASLARAADELSARSDL
jgi:aminoglycoside phosphotransferase (APT) family kinase protein